MTWALSGPNDVNVQRSRRRTVAASLSQLTVSPGLPPSVYNVHGIVMVIHISKCIHISTVQATYIQLYSWTYGKEVQYFHVNLITFACGLSTMSIGDITLMPHLLVDPVGVTRWL